MDFYTEKLPAGIKRFYVLPSQGRDSALLCAAQGLPFRGFTASIPSYLISSPDGVMSQVSGESSPGSPIASSVY